MRARHMLLALAAAVGLGAGANAELMVGGTGGNAQDAEELCFNTRFSWSFTAKDADAANAWLKKEMGPCEKAGVKHFWVCPFMPQEAATYSEYTESGRKYKAFDTGYSWLGPLGTRWMQMVEQYASWKLPMLYNFIPDEMYYNNCHVPYTFRVPINPKTPWYVDTPEDRAAFEKASGLKFPNVTPSRFLGGDTKENRAFILWRYHTFADTVKAWHARARAVNPDIQTTVIFNFTNVYGLERYPSGFAPDMFGEDAGLTYASATAFQCSYDWRGRDSHYFTSENVKHLIAGFPAAKVIAFPSATVWRPDTQQLGCTFPREIFPKLRPIDLTGVAVSTIGHGAEGCTMFAAGDRGARYIPEIWDAERRSFKTLREISPWVEGSQVPGRIVLLHSRTGEDWYALAHEPRPDAAGDGSTIMRDLCDGIQMVNYVSYHLDQNAEHSRGFPHAHKNAIHFLFKNAMPFRLHYLDTLKAQDIADAKVILLPFAHSISKEASILLHKAAADGKKIVLLGMLGERDPEGEYYPQPLLADLLARPNVRFFDGGVALGLPDPSVAAQVRAVMLDLLGPDAPISFTPDPRAEIEVALREKSAEDKTLFLVNWSETAVKVKAGITLPKGAYRVTAHDMDKIAPFGTAKTYSETDLAALPVEMPPLSTLILHVERAQE